MFEHRSTIHWRKFSEISDCREPSFLQTLRGCRISYLDTAKNICPALSIFVSLSMLSFPNLELLGWQCLASRLLRARRSWASTRIPVFISSKILSLCSTVASTESARQFSILLLLFLLSPCSLCGLPLIFDY